MTTITLAQPRKVVTAIGDTATASLDTTPTLGNSVVALVAAYGDNLYNVSPADPGYPWQGVSIRSTTKLVVAAYVAQMVLPSNLDGADLAVTVEGADRIVVHLYEVQSPPDGFAFNLGLVAPGGVVWTNYSTPYGTSASLSFAAFPFFGGDLDMATVFMAAFSEPLSNTTSEPTVTPDFGGNIGPATDGGRFASEFASTTIEGAGETWTLGWSNAQPDGAIVMGLGQIAEKTSYSLVQRKAALSASTTLSATPTVGNLLVASLGMPDGEVVPAKTGWNRIVGPAGSDGTRICIFWREVAGTPSAAIEFDADNCFGMSVEEWSGFYGSPFIHSSAVGATFDIQDGLSAMGALLPPIGLLDRITYTTIALEGYPSGGVAIGSGYQTGIAGQRVYAGGSGSSINSNFYPSLGGATWESTAALDGTGLAVVFGDGAEAVAIEAPVDPEEPVVGPFVFPDEGSRLAYSAPSRRGGALTSAKGVEGYVYLDAEGDTLAPITDLSGDPIAGSLITVGADSKLPLFQGPGTVKTLYIRWANSSAIHPIYARNQTAPVDYGSLDLTGVAKLAEANRFTEIQGVYPTIPTYTMAEVMDGAEFVLISEVGDGATDSPIIKIMAAKVEVAPGQVLTVFGTVYPEYGTDGNPTGRSIVSAGTTEVYGGYGGWSHVILESLRISELFSNLGIIMPVRVGDPEVPVESPEDGYQFAASRGWVVQQLEGVEPPASNEVNVLDFGAVLDGITDDTDAIEAALAAAEVDAKGVFIPHGTMLIRRNIVLPANMALRGAGMDHTTITKPPTVASPLVGTAGPGATSVTVTDGSLFAVGDSIHVYDTEYFEGSTPGRHITEVDGDTLTFTPALDLSYSGGSDGMVTTTFGLVRNEVGADNCSVSDLTLDQNANEFDPGGSYGNGTSQVDFNLSALHWEAGKHCRAERMKFINIPGDAYSDQGRSNTVGPNHNLLQGCIFENPYRHAIHLGTYNQGARIHRNFVTGVGEGYCVFLCANSQDGIFTDNYFTMSDTGFGGVDERDVRNVISGNTFWNVNRPIVTQGPSTDDRFTLLFKGNILYSDEDAPFEGGIGSTLTLPKIIFVNNSLHNQFLRLADGANGAVVSDNIFSGDEGYELRPPAGSDWCIWVEASDVILSNNTFKRFINAVRLMGAHGLVATGNKFSDSVQDLTGWAFDAPASEDCSITGARASKADGYIDNGDYAVRLVFNGMGEGGTLDPSVSGPWFDITDGLIPARKELNGTMVRWLDGTTTTISMFVSGVGWITIGTA